MHYSRTPYVPPKPISNRPVSELIVEAFRNGHPLWQIASRCQVPRSRVVNVLVRAGEINALTTSEEPRAVKHDRSKVGTPNA